MMATFKSLFLLCCFSSVLTTPTERHHSPKLHTSMLQRNKRASHVARKEHPWHVFVSSLNCSGVFVHERWILSSAFCVNAFKTQLTSDGLFPSEGFLERDQNTVYIRAGNDNLGLETPDVDLVPVLAGFVYPKYNANTSSGNLGLLYLARDVMLPNGRPAQRIKLPDLKVLNSIRRPTDRSAKVTGWGHLSGREQPFRTLHEDDVSLARVCLQMDNQNHRELLDESWCVVAGTRGMCSIDQGSPLVIQRNRAWVLLGVYSRGETCASGNHVALFSRIDAEALKWIQKLFVVGDKPQCKTSGYKILDSPTRALSSKVKFAAPLCDSNLEEAWYKLEINGLPAEIPRSCPGIGSCGTHAQVWMLPEDHPGFGEERNGSACVAWEGLERICCMWQLPLHVTHCGDFVVYRLKKTEECSMAYCAQEAARVPCGPGKIGFVPRCKERDPYPSLAGQPHISPVAPPDNIVASSSVHLLCTYDIKDPGPFHVSYKVTWFKIMHFLGGKTGKMVLLFKTTEEKAVVIGFGSADFHLGDTIVCEVAAFYLQSPDRISPSSSSRGFYVGIKVEPSSLVISEDQTIKEITLSLTVPLVCPADHPNCTIQIPIHLEPAFDNSKTLSAPDLALSTCMASMKPQSCSLRDCGRTVVRLVAVSDFINDGNRWTRIITEPARTQSPLWKLHDPPDAFVQSKNIKTPRCYLFSESYIKTLSGRYYRISSGEITFVSYKSTVRPFEVHTRFWKCRKSANPSFCACGVAVRDVDDVIVIDMCEGRFLETSIQISIRSRLPLTKRIRITEAISGKRYTVYFPSGVYVRTDMFEWGLNIQVQSSGRDLNHVTGLCGMGKVNGSSKVVNEGLPDEIKGTGLWRLSDTESLFRYKPPAKRQHKTENFFCVCSLENNNKRKKKCNSCESKCRRQQHIVWPAVSQERDITSRVQSLQTGRELEHRRNVSNASNKFYSLEQNPSNQFNPYGDGSPNNLLTVLAVISYCKRLLTSSPLARACRPFIGQQNVDQLLRICIRDMRYTGVLSMAWGTAVMLQDLCEDVVLRNTSTWETSGDKLTPPKSIVNTMCSRLCHDRGRCINGTCKCRRGYTGDDCSVPYRRPPQLISIHNGGQCDIRTFHCKQVRVVGEGFHNSKNLKCSVAEIQQASVGSRIFLSKATYESHRGVTCEVPRSHDTDVALSDYHVRVSNDGHLWSQPLPFLILDGLCLTCTARDMRCEIKNGTCRIDGRCRRSGQLDPRDPCKWCSPKESQQDWTNTCVHGVCLDTTEGRYFCFCDEGFTGLNCNVPENSCSSNPCGRGTCVQLGNGFYCKCPLGFTGIRCSEVINPCASNPCNNGSCLNINGTHFQCFCDESFTGKYCETIVRGFSCPDGRCLSQQGNSVCICPMGFTVNLRELCSSLLCRHDSRVVNNTNANCLCDCEHNGILSGVGTGPCRNALYVNGSCASSPFLHKNILDDMYHFTCACEFGFTGIISEKEINANKSLTNIIVINYRNKSSNTTCYQVKISFNGAENHTSDEREPRLAFLKSHTISSISEGNALCQLSNCSVKERMYFWMLDAINRTCGCVLHFELHHGEGLNSSVAIMSSKGFVKECSDGRTCNEAEDPCYPNPCAHGNCTFSDKGILCVCENGYKGHTCNETMNDFCQSSPCFRGECRNTGNGFHCLCPKGFAGATCDQVKTPCNINICKHGDCFIDPSGELSCECFNGFQGTLCENLIHRCELGVCNNGRCVDKSRGFQCLCLSGFSGKRCHIRDFCVSNPCVNGICTSKSDGHHCVCHEGYTGKTCNYTIDHCQPNPCARGQCLNTQGTYVCSCPQGFIGRTCNETVNLCQSNPCLNGKCINLEASFKCDCHDGFEGILCDKLVFNDPCHAKPCSNGRCTHVQAAIRSAAKFHCLCDEGFTGPFCDSKIDPCLNNPCKHGLCVDPDSLFHCLCDEGYTGTFCESKIDPCSTNPCKNGVCVVTEDVNSFRCNCFKGYRGNKCDTEINHCIPSPCNNGSCIPKNDSFECLCNTGYSGQFCESKLDACMNNPCKHGLCIAADAINFRCKCFKSFQGNTCDTEINHCISSPCQNGSCIPANSSFECLCNPGYHGKLCDQTVDMCEPNPCKHGRCQLQGLLSFKCLCYSGYNGTYCETMIDSCQSNPCKHGVCIAKKISFKCYCKRGYSGDLCQHKINPCNPNPCQHGSCLHQYTSWFTCRCDLGYTGKLCDKEINMCQPDPCKHGTCNKLGMSFRCRCTPGFYGRLCDKIVSCQSRPCRRGKCIVTARSFTCRCPNTYTGRHCENKIDPCQSSPCQNGNCIQVNQSSRCICSKGYTGIRCQVRIDPCSLRPCKNGKCITTASSSFKCICGKGYTGDHCEVSINPCSSHACVNGTCIAQGNQYSCKCYQGYTGKHCDEDINECLEPPCFDGVECTNYLGSFACGPCPDGFTGNGSSCEEILTDHCKKLKCFKDVSCVPKGARYKCGNCPRGFTGNGVQCTEIDACSSSPCHSLVQCFTVKDSQLGFRCGPCPEGHTGNGINCTSLCPFPCPYGMKCVDYYTCRCPEGFHGVGCKTPFCRAGCYNGGTCVKPNVCKCAEGYEGPSCLSPVCRPPCRFGGKCIGPGNCRCPHGFEGSRCQDTRCLVTCLNGGRCMGPYVCKCMSGYLGRRCEIAAPCSPRCQNGGLCVTRNVCKCPAQYLGERCQFPVCRPPCINGGHCIRPNVCMCPTEWKGAHCQKPVCHLPCLNGGRCAQPNQCTCLSGYNGIMCEKAICNQPCLNGGKCVRPGVCACPFGFTGRQCEERDPWNDSAQR